MIFESVSSYMCEDIRGTLHIMCLSQSVISYDAYDIIDFCIKFPIENTILNMNQRILENIYVHSG